MGQDKALISVGGESLIFHVYKAFKHQGLMKSSFLDYRIIIRAYRSYLMTLMAPKVRLGPYIQYGNVENKFQKLGFLQYLLMRRIFQKTCVNGYMAIRARLRQRLTELIRHLRGGFMMT